MEAIGNIAKAPVTAVWTNLSESVNQIAAESSILAKFWHLLVVLFLVCMLVVATTWFIVVKATQVTLIITIGLFSLTLIFNADG